MSAVAVTTRGDTLVAARDDALEDLHRDGVAAALSAKDASLWGPQSDNEAARRLGWLDVVEASRPLVAEIAALHDELRAEGLDRVVLAGMGGSSLAPEVIARNASALPAGRRLLPPPAGGAGLVVLDSTDPSQVRSALTELERTIVVVSSKSGSTIEPDSHRRTFEQAFLDAGLSPDEVARRFVVVTDPGSPLEQTASDARYRKTFLADPNVGGRYSALTAFGLVPSGLAGVDIGGLLDEAAAVRPSLGTAPNGGRRQDNTADRNPGLALGAALGGGAARAGRTTIAIEPATDDGLVGFGDWAEQLLAESTGKQGTGLLPVALPADDTVGVPDAPDLHRVTLAGDPGAGGGTSVHGPLAAQFLVWEYATAIAGRELGIDPFDQPNVQESKDNTTALLDAAGEGALPEQQPAFADGAIEGYAEHLDLSGASDVGAALRALLAAIPAQPDGAGGYLAVMAYLDRHADAAAGGLRAALARRTSRPVTFGWGPRFLHSTGQYHKGGPPVGVYLQVTGTVADDLPVPGRPFSFGKLQAAQTLGDLRALAGRDRPVLRLHLTDRAAGLEQLLAAAEAA
jgi:glucose-6-phosphate isomerase